MRCSAIIAINAIVLIHGKRVNDLLPKTETNKKNESGDSGKHREHQVETSVGGKQTDSASKSVPDWTQYTGGNRSDWEKYMRKPGENATDNSQDWMKYAGTYMGSSGNGTGNTSGNSTEWNNGQGDGYGEPFRTKTGGDFRYKSGREWNTSSGGWEQFAAPYSSVNPEQPGGSKSSNKSEDQSPQDWQKYMGGSGDQYWKKYMDHSGGQDWNKYIGESGGASSTGGFFEIQVSGKELNVTTDFGLGQGKGSNGTGSTNSSMGSGGGGGNQNSITAKQGKIFIRGRFLNDISATATEDIIPA